MRGLLSAVSFLTLLPVPSRVHRDRAGLARAIGWYPAVGLLVGAVAALAWMGLAAFPPLPRAVVASLVPVLLTRALHLDGFADTCDGLGIAGPPVARLAVMRDPRLGTFGVAGLAFNLLWRVAVLASPLAHPAAALIAAPVLGRWAMVLALRRAPYGGGGRLTAAAPRPGWGALLGASVLPVLLLPFSDGRELLALVLIPVLVWGWLRVVRRRFGELTGDTLGALNELAELLALACFLPG